MNRLKTMISSTWVLFLGLGLFAAWGIWTHWLFDNQSMAARSLSSDGAYANIIGLILIGSLLVLGLLKLLHQVKQMRQERSIVKILFLLAFLSFLGGHFLGLGFGKEVTLPVATSEETLKAEEPFAGYVIEKNKSELRFRTPEGIVWHGSGKSHARWYAGKVKIQVLDNEGVKQILVQEDPGRQFIYAGYLLLGVAFLFSLSVLLARDKD